MNNIPDYFNKPNPQLLILMSKFIDSFPFESGNIIADSILATSQKFNISIEFVRRIVLDRTYFAVTKNEEDIFNYFQHHLENALLVRL